VFAHVKLNNEQDFIAYIQICYILLCFV